MRFAQVPQMKETRLRRLLGEKNFALELELNRLDCIACHGLFDAWLRLIDEVHRLAGVVELPPPWLTGRELIAAGLTPGPRFGKLLERLYELQLSGAWPDREAALEALGKMDF